MQIELRKTLALRPGTFSAVVAPERMMADALNSNADLQRFLFLYIGGNFSRILPGLNRTSKNFEIRRSFTAHQLLSTLREAGHTVIFVEHDPTLFENAMDMIEPISGALREAGRESLVILYTPAADRPFSLLARQADRFIEVISIAPDTPHLRTARALRDLGRRPAGQTALEV